MIIFHLRCPFSFISRPPAVRKSSPSRRFQLLCQKLSLLPFLFPLSLCLQTPARLHFPPQNNLYNQQVSFLGNWSLRFLGQIKSKELLDLAHTSRSVVVKTVLWWQGGRGTWSLLLCSLLVEVVRPSLVLACNALDGGKGRMKVKCPSGSLCNECWGEVRAGSQTPPIQGETRQVGNPTEQITRLSLLLQLLSRQAFPSSSASVRNWSWRECSGRE